MQIVIAGKAHPKDQPGKTFIREIVQFSRDPDLWKHVVFVEDYDMKVARELVQGVDLWLNNPRRGEEACGTSGMKAAINGVLNLSILDGWFDEGYEMSGGWAIGDREPYSEDQDAMHASTIYYLLENEIVPMFYAQSESGVSSEWMRRMKTSMKNLTPPSMRAGWCMTTRPSCISPRISTGNRCSRTISRRRASVRAGMRASAKSGRR